MVLNAISLLTNALRAVVWIHCLGFISPKGSPRRQRAKINYNPIRFNDISTTINTLPNGLGGRFMCHFSKILLLDPILFYLTGIGTMVRSFRNLWFDRPPRKPPHQPKAKHLRRKPKHPLSLAMALMTNSPEIVQGSTRATFEHLGFSAQEELHKHEDSSGLSNEKAKAIRELIQGTMNEDSLTSINGITGVIDSGASAFSTFDENDFVEGTYEECKNETVMKGIAGGLPTLGKGLISYEVVDHHGVTQTIQGKGILIKDLPCRLIPPQRAMPDDSHGYYRINGQEAKFVFNNN